MRHKKRAGPEDRPFAFSSHPNLEVLGDVDEEATTNGVISNTLRYTAIGERLTYQVFVNLWRILVHHVVETNTEDPCVVLVADREVVVVDIRNREATVDVAVCGTSSVTDRLTVVRNIRTNCLLLTDIPSPATYG